MDVGTLVLAVRHDPCRRLGRHRGDERVVQVQDGDTTGFVGRKRLHQFGFRFGNDLTGAEFA